MHNVLHTTVMPSAECHADHCLVCCKFCLNFNPKPKRGNATGKMFWVGNLQLAEVKVDFQGNLQSELEVPSQPVEPSPEAVWEHLKTAILQSLEEILGFSSKKNKDWFNENNQEIQELLAKKRFGHQADLVQPSCLVKKAAFLLICSNLQRKLREIQNE